MAGKVIRCTKCQTQIRVPGSQPAAPTNDVFDDLPTSGPADDPFGDLSPVASQNAGPAGGSFVGSSATFTPPSTAANPYATPASTSQQTYHAGSGSLPSGRSPALYLIPGIIIVLWASLIILVGLVGAGFTIFMLANGQLEIGPNQQARFAGEVTGRVLAILAQVVALTGGIAMIRRRNLGTAKGAAVISAIPCFGCLIFPIGIWACVLVFSHQAQQDFDS